MKKTISITFVVLVCLALLVSIAVVTPKAVQAGVATLIRDQDNAARHPFSVRCPNTTTATICTINLQAGQEYVIQNVTVSANVSGATGVVTAVYTTTGGNPDTVILQQPIPLIVPGAVLQTYNIIGYADPGTNIICGIGATGSNPILSEFACSISGYYVTLP